MPAPGATMQEIKPAGISSQPATVPTTFVMAY